MCGWQVSARLDDSPACENAGIVTYGEKEITNEVRAEWLWRSDIGVGAF
jgi:hypothetical protein